MLLEMSISAPILLPPMRDLLTNPQGGTHPLIENKTLKLVAWKISGLSEKQWDFRKTLPNSWLADGGKAPNPLTTAAGDTGIAGVVNGTWIPFRPLWNL